MTDRLVVFGASGATGRQVVALAAAADWQVSGFVRQALPPAARVRWAIGDPTDIATVADALAGAAAVAVCLGISRRSRSPFAPLVSPPDLTSRALRAILLGMQLHGVRRIVYVSAFGASESWARIPPWGRAFIRASRVRYSIADHTRSEALLMQSGLDWTALRPMMLDDTPATRPGLPMQPGASLLAKVPRAALARSIVQMLRDRSTFGRAIALTAPGSPGSAATA
jgi:uncharacterized protein YbjT (DUF2867 family)